ncbi:sporulation-control protein [Marinithermofilum abyssi]|uniref:Sporulation-control protein n=1 Tax=Marinithermofilum abyssi TaxID=1571185 RepID=A0A8J2Y9R9_9BACL|nr:sporulation protein [Marinithermofilum abyssi]GGE26996.1 sporulation-control protein [Marinithermofilum abyssi]
MVFDKALASIGIGAARVDTRLEKTQFQPGELVRGEILVRGGQADQLVDDIYLFLTVHYLKNDKKIPYVLQKYQLSEFFVVKAEEYKLIPFQIRLPLETPMSCGRFPIYLKTGLDIKKAVDPKDVDRIEVFPHRTVERILGEIEKADFILYKVFNEEVKEGALPFVQIFQFRPSGRYHGYLDELNLYFDLTAHDVSMYVEIRRGTQQLSTCFDWSLEDPNATFMMKGNGGQQEVADPVATIQSMLRK